MASQNPGTDSPLYPGLLRRFHDAASEEAVSAFWKENRTFARSIEQRDGAPVASARREPPTSPPPTVTNMPAG